MRKKGVMNRLRDRARALAPSPHIHPTMVGTSMTKIRLMRVAVMSETIRGMRSMRVVVPGHPFRTSLGRRLGYGWPA
jgi:hypothetical protein